MKAQPTSALPPAPGQELLDELIGHWFGHWDGNAIWCWLERGIVLLRGAQIELGGPFELLESEEFDPAQLEDADLPA